MSLKKIEKVSLAYRALFIPLSLFHRLFYCRFTVLGRRNIPKDKPVMFLPNHQNALMDALAILFGYNHPTVFLARADLFKKKGIARFMYYLKIMPVFRIRDGKENLSHNDDTFRRSMEVLARPRPVAMFPEGVFNPGKSLLSLKKGFARIAFMAEDFSNFDLQIIPVGLDYDDKPARFSNLLVQFGEPIPVAAMLPLYRENPALGYNELMERVQEGLRPLMIDIHHPEYGQTYMRVFECCEPPGRADKSAKPFLRRRFLWQRDCTSRLNALADENPGAMQELDAAAGDYFDGLKERNVVEANIASSSPNPAVKALSAAARILSALLWLPNFAIHLLPLLAARLVLPKMKDKQFVSSVKFVTWFAASMLYYPLAQLAICFTGLPLAVKILFLPILCAHGILTEFWTARVKKLPEYMRFCSLGKADYTRLKDKRDKMMTLLKKYAVVAIALIASIPLAAQTTDTLPATVSPDEETEIQTAEEALQETKKEKVKTGFSFGVLPVVAFDTDLGFQYGGLVSLYDYRSPVRYPDYRQMWKVEASAYTKGSSTFQVYYDAKNLLPKNLRLVANLAFMMEKKLDFYGFNGYQSLYNPDFIDEGSDVYLTRVFYNHQRNQLRFTTDLIGPIPVKGMQWLAGVGLFYTKVAKEDIAQLNKKKKKNAEPLPEGVPTLYERYVDWGIIPEKEAKGGFSNYLKAGLLYDTRNQEALATKGIWAEATFTYAPGWLSGGQSNYLKAEVAFRQYFTLVADKLSLAYRLAYQGTLAGHTPFYMQPYTINAYSPVTKLDGLGGAKNLRGIIRNRVVGDGFLYGNLELRWKFVKFNVGKQNIYLGLNAFADAGMVVQQIKYSDAVMANIQADPDYEKFFNFSKYGSHDSVHPSAGLGFRAALNQNFILAVDYGMPFNKQDGSQINKNNKNVRKGGLYINIGNLF